MFRWLVAIIALLLLVAALALVRFPAAQAWGLLSGELGAVQASGFSGTLWEGSARQVSVSGYRLGRVDWRLEPASLLRLAPEIHLQLDGPELSARGWLLKPRGAAHWQARELLATGPAAWLQLILQEPFFQLQGRLELDLKTVALSPDGRLARVEGRCRWDEAAVTGTVRTRLGPLWVDFATPRDGVVVGSLGDDGGPLGLSGSVVLSEGQYRVDAWLEDRANDEALRQALYVLGDPDSEGRMRLRIDGPLLSLEELLQ